MRSHGSDTVRGAVREAVRETVREAVLEARTRCVVPEEREDRAARFPSSEAKV